MLRDVVLVLRTRLCSMLLVMLTIKKRVAYVLISMHTCDSVSIIMVLRLAARNGAPL